MRGKPTVVVRIARDGKVLQTIALDRNPVLVGRGPAAHLDLPSSQISREHCRFELLRDQWQVQDLGSSNGTRVNGQLIEKHILESGDAIQVGEFVLWIQLITSEAQPLAAELGPSGDQPTIKQPATG